MATTSSYWDFIKQVLKLQRQVPGIRAVPREQRIPLAYPQQRLWFIDQLNPTSTAYTMPLPLRVSGVLDVALLEKSLNAVIQRHEILRTVFDEEDGQPYQKVLPELQVKIECQDFREERLPERMAFEWITRRATTPFCLAKAPLLRCAFARIENADAYLLFVIHHIVMDGWSVGIFMREVCAFYEGFLNGQDVNLPPLPVQFPDYAVWQRSEHNREVLEQQLGYWKQKLQWVPFNLELPTDHPRPALATFKGKIKQIKIPQPLMNALRSLRAMDEGLSLYMILLAALRVLFYRYSGQEEIIIGAPMANRNRNEIKDLIGFFVNTVPLCTNLAGNPTFKEFLKREKETCLEAYVNQDIPFEYLIDELHVPREPSRNPLFQVAFSFLQNATENEYQLGEAIAKPAELQRNGAIFDMVLYLYEIGEEAIGWFEYSTTLFEPETIEGFTRHYLQLLQTVADNPEQPILDIPLLTQDEHRQIVDQWNQTRRDYDRDICIHQLFEVQAQKSPQAVALEQEGQRLTYGELNAKANQLAHYLIRVGVKPGQVVGLCMERSFEMIVGLLAVLKAAGTYLPLEPSFPSERLEFMLQDSKVEVLLTQSNLLEKLPATALRPICLDTETQRFESESRDNLKGIYSADHLAYIIYTSGTTGTPKGVMVSHRPVINLIEWVNRTFKVGVEDQVLFVTSICFDLSVYDIFGLLAAGGSIFIPSESALKDPEQLLALMGKYPITFWDSAPATLVQLTPFFTTANSNWDRSNLRLVFLSGDWIPVQLPQKIRDCFPNAQVVSLGGATEATVWSNYYPIGEVNPEWSSIPYGKPIQNAEYYILDSQLRPCPVGVPGQLYIGGECLALGYANQPELTARKFIANPFSTVPNAKIYHTGDKARFWPDGTMEFLGRIDNQVKIRGFRIELEEIQRVLCQHAEVRDAIVMARESRQGDKRLAAYVVPKEDSQVSIRELHDFLQKKLPEYMIPAFFILLDHIPLNANGKVDRSALPEPAETVKGKKEHLSWQDETERIIAAIWSDVLGVENLSMDDDFFEMGGHSLLVTQVVSQMRKQLDTEVTVGDVYVSPTVREIAWIVKNGRAEAQYIELQAEAELEAPLPVTAVAPPPGLAGVRHILLTGSTGFIGRFLLAELLQSTQAKVYCLIRSRSAQEAFGKQKGIMVANGLWDESYQERMIGVAGDLAQPKLGLDDQQYLELSRKIDVIYHNGAIADYLGHYSNLKPSNVNGTKEIVLFAATSKVKPIHYSSTITVYNTGENRVVDETTPIDQERHEKFPGYFGSKWVGEQILLLARSYNIPCNIYRFGLIMGDSAMGRYDRHQWFYLLMKSFLLLGYAFDNRVPEFHLPVSPVDLTVKGLVHLSLQPDLQNRVFHLCGERRIPVQSLVEVYNQTHAKPIQVVDFYQWLRIAEEYVGRGHSLPILAFVQHYMAMDRETLDTVLEQFRNRKVHVDCTRTRRELAKVALELPDLTSEIVNTYFQFLLRDDAELQKIG